VRIVRAGRRAFVLPLVSPLATAHGAIAERAGFLVSLADEAGRVGSGEATPLPAFGGETLDHCREALDRGLARLADGVERSIDEALAIAAEAAGAGRETDASPAADAGDASASGGVAAPCARAALECAIADLAAQRAGQSLASWIRLRAGLAGGPAARVRSQALVAGGDAAGVAAAARRARAAGFEVFKLKLAAESGRADVDRDVERVAALREAVGPAARIRLDANEAWGREEARRALARLAPFSIEFVEQPVARDDVVGLAELDRGGPIAVAADEALQGDGLEACLARRAARVFVVKPAILGGIGPTIALAARARAAGIRLVVSNLIEGRVGRALACALAAGLAPGPGGSGGSDADAGGSGDGNADADTGEVHGLGTAELLARDLPCVSEGGPGLGVSPGACWASEDAIFREPCRTTSAAPSSANSTGWLDRFVAPHAEREAIAFEGRTLAHRELACAARAAGDRLAAFGIEAGELVAVLAPPSLEGVVLFHALLERGIVLLPLNLQLREPELVDALGSTRAKALVVAESIDPGLAARLTDPTRGGPIGLALGDLVSAPTTTPSSTPTSTPPSGSSSGPSSGSRSRSQSASSPDSAAAVTAATPRATRLRDQGAALVLRTSGTSGRPKAAVLSRANLIASARASARLLGGGADDRWLVCMPLFHVAGLSMLVRAAIAGGAVVVHPRFDAARVAASLDADRITQISLVATTLEQLLDARASRGARSAPETLRVALIGGGPASQALLARAVAAGIPIAPTYGLTEAASQVATRPPEAGARGAAARELANDMPNDVANDLTADLASGLVPLPGVEVRIVDSEGRALAAGVEGGIELRGPIVMQGYLDDPEATARALRGGWLATGDVGRLDAAGRLRVFDRRADLILSGGENVYPAEIESVLAGHPDVVEAGVVGVADARFGARPLAFVVWRAGAAREPRTLADWCRARLAGFKQPIGFVSVESLPRNAAGKLLRRELAARRLGG